MRLDAPTLMLVTAFVALIAGLLFLLSWSQDRREPALAVWGIAHLVGAAASALSCLRLVLPADLAIGLGNALLLAAYGLIWSGARAFAGRGLALGRATAMSAAWLAAWTAPAFASSLEARVVLASLGAGLYCALGALELGRGRREVLASRGMAVSLLATYAAAYLARVPVALAGPVVTPGTDPLASPWVTILCFAGVLYAVAIAFAFMALAKERVEGEQRRAAGTDSLTGAATRRALAEAARHRLAGSRPAALILFDLDHFKRVNDTYGHATGDAVLCGFAGAARALVPEGAVVARLGGEEFACLVDGLDGEAAARLGDLVRRSVAATELPAWPGLRQTVSVGIATTADGRRDFDDLLRRADAALYRAKRAGRNRVEHAEAA